VIIIKQKLKLFHCKDIQTSEVRQQLRRRAKLP